MQTDSARNTAEANMTGESPPVPAAAPAAAVATGPPAGRPGIISKQRADIPNEAASTPNAAVDAWVAATRAPPAAGPSSEPAWTAAVDSAFPAASRSPSSSDGMIA